MSERTYHAVKHRKRGIKSENGDPFYCTRCAVTRKRRRKAVWVGWVGRRHKRGHGRGCPPRYLCRKHAEQEGVL